MLNKGLHSEGVQSSEFKVQSNETNLTSASGMPRHPELDSGSHARGSQLETRSYSLNPQKPFAYETCLTKKAVQFISSPTQLSSNLPSADGGDPGYPGEGGVSSANYDIVYHINNLIDPTLLDLRLPLPTQTERSNTDLTTKCRILSLRSDCSFVVASALTIVNSEIAPGISENNGFNINKNRIDKQPYRNVDPQTKTKKFCDFNSEMILDESENSLFVPGSPRARISPPCKGGASLTEASGRGGLSVFL
ncbi:hypothetical protein [Maribellus sediminis]|uniref:hypothetical protein n=1 Tax=Maribellus sediminis TaxID=2696285 RepID=UPI001430A1D5|nr:hypothetical protein [Maribellus sediminis]